MPRWTKPRWVKVWTIMTYELTLRPEQAIIFHGHPTL